MKKKLLIGSAVSLALVLIAGGIGLSLTGARHLSAPSAESLALKGAHLGKQELSSPPAEGKPSVEATASGQQTAADGAASADSATGQISAGQAGSSAASTAGPTSDAAAKKADKGPVPRPLIDLLAYGGSGSSSPDKTSAALDTPPPPDLLGADGKPVAAATAPVPPSWTVEVGLFATRDGVDRKMSLLKKDFPTVSLAAWKTQDGQLWYSASIPDLRPRGAIALAYRLKEQGEQTVMAVPPPSKTTAAPSADAKQAD